MKAMGSVKINESRCKGCELCISVCPKSVLQINDESVNKMGYHPAEVRIQDECTACANCAIMCPDGAISVYRETRGAE